jgi:SSS family solute:Na+ symporter
MIEPVYLYTAISIFFLCMFLIAHYGHMKTGSGVEEYYIAGRKIGGFVSALTYSATTYSAFMMVGLVGITWAGGVGALGFELTYLMGTALLLVVFAPRFLLAGRRWGYVTPTELLSRRYENSAVGVIATLLCLTFLIPYVSVQATGSAYLMSTLTGGGIPYQTGLLFTGVVIAVLAWWGGMRGVAWSDAAQALVMVVTSTALLCFLVHQLLGGWGGLFTTLENEYPALLTTPGPNTYFNFPKFLGLTLPWFFFALTNPQVSQRLFIPKSVGSARNMIWGFLIFGFVYTLICTLFGLTAHVLYPAMADPDMVMPTLLAERAPIIASLLITLGILAAAVTTANSIILTLGSMVARDVYKALGRTATEHREMQVGRIIILVMAAALIAFSWRPFGLIVELSVLSSAGLLALVPALIGAFFWRKATGAGALASMIIGGLMTATLYFGHVYPLGQWPGVWGFVCTGVTFIVVSLVTNAPEHAGEFLDALDDDLREKNITRA